MQQHRKHGGNLKEASELYHIDEDELLDFSANINPLGPPAAIYEVITNNLAKIKHYPDSRNKDLKNRLAAHLSLSDNNIVMGNGASELIFLLINYLRPSQVWIPSPTFAEYEIAARSCHAQITRLPLGGEKMNIFNLDKLQGMAENDLIFICNPNNPTGQLYPAFFLEEVYNIIKNSKAYFVIDESFLDFLEDKKSISFMGRINEYSRLIVLYSLTKFFTIPGLRLGALITNPSLAGEFEGIRDPWNINIFAQLAGVTALQDEDFMKTTLDFYKEEKKFLFSRLAAMEGIRPLPPSANFIFIKLQPPHTASKICELLAHENILVRNCNSYPYLGEEYLRVAIKARAENLRLLAKLEEKLSNNGT
ncbi:MAG: threonine-phosphate decarboxylase CobD [Peptococcaceae bacterium]